MSADQIYTNGTIITVAESQPEAEALAVKDGKILAIGSSQEVLKLQGPETIMVDLKGHTMVPGFVDGHSHFMNALQIVTWSNYSAPPVGPVRSIKDILAVLEEHKKRLKPAPGEWIIGYGYDGNMLEDGRELTKDDLDPHSPDNPVLIIHVSNHGGVFNSAALAFFGINADTPTPPGGIIARKPGSNEPAGLIQETAFLPIFPRIPKPGPEELLERMQAAQAIYASAGITTAVEGATSAPDLALLVKGAAQGRLYLDVVSNILVTELEEVLKEHPVETFGRYQNRLKLRGVKTFADGVPMSRTAFFTQPYLLPGPNGESPWRGEPMFPLETFQAMFDQAYRLGLPLSIHCNGDAGLDMLLAAHEKAAGDRKGDKLGTTIIHAQFARPDQLEKCAKYQINVSFYTEHTFFFADTHLKNLGPERTHPCSPMRTALSLGLHCTNHTDFSVLPIDQLMTMWTAVNRIARSGLEIGPQERVTPLQALRAITIEGAHQHGEEDSKGSLEVGKLADLTILSANPLEVEPMSIKEIQVLGTVKEGRVIYRAEQASFLPAADSRARVASG
ncbi:MAG: hypothetical protein AMXMBFR33_10870 [Candidatus Xenobia bacterium]